MRIPKILRLALVQRVCDVGHVEDRLSIPTRITIPVRAEDVANPGSARKVSESQLGPVRGSGRLADSRY